MLSLLIAVPVYSADRDVAYVEEIVILPDGTESVTRYNPNDVVKAAPPQRFHVEQKPRQRGLMPHEKIELDRLERDYNHGVIGEAEYNRRVNEILRSTYVDGAPQDRLFERSIEF